MPQNAGLLSHPHCWPLPYSCAPTPQIRISSSLFTASFHLQAGAQLTCKNPTQPLHSAARDGHWLPKAAGTAALWVPPCESSWSSVSHVSDPQCGSPAHFQPGPCTPLLSLLLMQGCTLRLGLLSAPHQWLMGLTLPVCTKHGNKWQAQRSDQRLFGGQGSKEYQKFPIQDIIYLAINTCITPTSNVVQTCNQWTGLSSATTKHRHFREGKECFCI